MGEVDSDRIEAELIALVDIPTPNGDVGQAEAAFTAVKGMLPAGAEVERMDSSTPGHAPTLVARMAGTGERRMLLLGHVDTVFSADEHQAAERRGGRIYGSGTIDMKGGDAIALEVMRRLAEEPAGFAELALMFVADEEWRTHDFAHGPDFDHFDACLCFEAGERNEDGVDAVIVRRKAAGTLRVWASGKAAHSGAAPDDGRSALLALARVAQDLAQLHDPGGEQRLTVVPTILNSGEAINVVPASGELSCDLRADSAGAFGAALRAIPPEIDEVSLVGGLTRVWPGMDSREAAAGVLDSASAEFGRPIGAAGRGGASDASHFAAHIPLTIDGLGPIGGGAHTAAEFVEIDSLGPRAELALAVARSALSA